MSNAAESDTWKVNTGGIAGYLEDATLKSCVAEGAVVTATKSYDVGGIAGITENAAKIIDCKLTDYTRVFGANRTGGIVGYMMGKTNTTISDCVVSGSEIKGTLNLGGIVGWLDTGTIEYCTITDGSLINGSGDGVGGIVGRAISKGGTSNLINGCVIDGDALVTGAYSVGGIVGYEYPDANGPVDIYNCGVYKAIVQATSCDTGGDPSKGDCMIGGIAGWVRCKDSASTFKIVNCCMNGEIVCEPAMAHPSAGSMVGYCSLSSAGTGLIANCSTNLTAESLTVNGVPITSSCTSYGAIVGMLPDHSGINVTNCYYMEGKGLGAGDIGASVVQTNVEAVAEATFKDGTTVPGYLNTYASAYSGYTLSLWDADTSGFPCLK